MDHVVFFSIQEMVEAYYKEMSCEESVKKFGKKLIKYLREVLNEFVDKMAWNEDLFENEEE